ncbi:partitioning defective 6 homolog gamma-like [Petromyzon marinus]|uniref:partitioning defective 6 homolog gamma-like n=1 Tax=Petromyzon marinus TaxID=7757 RepID=UPI003F729771
MARSNVKSARASDVVEVKSKYEAEFRRFSVSRASPLRLGDFSALVLSLHGVAGVAGTGTGGGVGVSPCPVGPPLPPPPAAAAGSPPLPAPRLALAFADAQGELLPLTSDERLRCAVARAAPLLRLVLQRGDEPQSSAQGGGSLPRRRRGFAVLRAQGTASQRPRPHRDIGRPLDFRPVCSVIDVDLLPASVRRVRLHRPPLPGRAPLPLGFFIRAGGAPPPGEGGPRAPGAPRRPRRPAPARRLHLAAAVRGTGTHHGAAGHRRPGARGQRH